MPVYTSSLLALTAGASPSRTLHTNRPPAHFDDCMRPKSATRHSGTHVEFPCPFGPRMQILSPRTQFIRRVFFVPPHANTHALPHVKPHRKSTGHLGGRLLSGCVRACRANRRDTLANLRSSLAAHSPSPSMMFSHMSSESSGHVAVT